MTKVLILGTKAQGGMNYVIQSYLKSNLAEKYHLKYIPTHYEANPVIKICYFGFSLMRVIPYLFNKEYSIFHMHLSTDSSIYRKRILLEMAHAFGKKVILHTHGAEFFKKYNNKSEQEKRFIRKTLNKTDLLIVLSYIRKKEYSKIVPPEKIIHVYNFTPDPKFNKTYTKYSKNDSKNKLPCGIVLGRIGERKGIGLLINAVNDIRKVKFIINIYGDGDIETYRKKITGLKLEKQVFIPGWISGKQKEKILENADFFILPSFNEDLPIGIIEAMSYKLPIISTRTGGIPEQVKNNFNGVLIDCGDKKALAKAIRHVASNSKLREKMGKNSYKLYLEKFERSVVEKQISKIYDDLGRKK
jgi:glycosyltransferase involved in cell wall biosynthesis